MKGIERIEPPIDDVTRAIDLMTDALIAQGLPFATFVAVREEGSVRVRFQKAHAGDPDIEALLLRAITVALKEKVMPT